MQNKFIAKWLYLANTPSCENCFLQGNFDTDLFQQRFTIRLEKLFCSHVAQTGVLGEKTKSLMNCIIAWI